MLSAVAGVFLGIALAAVTVRLGVHWSWKKSLAADDRTICIGTFFAIIQTVYIFLATSHGLDAPATTSDSPEFETVEKFVYAADMLYITSIAGSKIAAALFMGRLSSFQPLLLIARLLTGLLTICALAGVLAVGMRPGFVDSWNLREASNDHLVNVWIGVVSLGLLAEPFLVAMPIYTVWHSRVERNTKMALIVSFALRSPISALSIVRLISIKSALMGPMNGLSDGLARTAALTEAEMHLFLCVTTIPCLALLIRRMSLVSPGKPLDSIPVTARAISVPMRPVSRRPLVQAQRREERKSPQDDMEIQVIPIDYGQSQSQVGRDYTRIAEDSETLTVIKTVTIDYRSRTAGPSEPGTAI